MSTESELQLMAQRLDRLERELSEARQQLLALELAKRAQQLDQAVFTSPTGTTGPIPQSANPAQQNRPEADYMPKPASVEETLRQAKVGADNTATRSEHPSAPNAPKLAQFPKHPEPPPLPTVRRVVQLPERIGRPTVKPAVVENLKTGGPSELQIWLEKLQLWPPSGGDNLEARLGAWWATRIGALLAVIGVVFFGVYVSRNTPAWVRFTELLVLSVGVTGLGLRLERKIEKFGAVIFGCGLALIHFTAFAAYAVAAVKVIDNVVIATVWQLASAALLVGVAVWRRSEVIAALGTGLGLATAFFAHGYGLNDFALWSAWLLGVASVVFYRRWRWESPSVLAMPGAYAVYAALWLGNWRPDSAPAQGWVWLFLGATGAIFFLRDCWATEKTPKKAGTAERWFQGLNSTAAVLLGVGTALTLYRASLGEFYFGAAGLLAVGAWLRRRQAKGDPISAVLTAKAAGAFTLGVIEQTGGRTTAIALLVQSGVMLWCAQRLASRTLAWGTGLVALAAAGFFAQDVQEGVSFMTMDGVSALGFVLGLILLGVEASRRLVPAVNREGQQQVEAAGAAIAGGLGALLTVNWQPTLWAPIYASALVVALIVTSAVRKAWGPALAGVITLLSAHGLIWQAALRPAPGGTILWWCALSVIGLTVLLGALPGSRWLKTLKAAEQSPELAAGYLFVAGDLAWGVAVAGSILVLFNQWAAPDAILAGSLVALGLGAALPVCPQRRFPWLATLAAGVSVLAWLSGGAVGSPVEKLVVAAIALWALPVALAAWPRHAALLQRESGAPLLRIVQLALAAVVTFKLCGLLFTGTGLVFAFALLALGTVSLVWWPGIAAGLPLSWFFWLCAAWAVGSDAVRRAVYEQGASNAASLPTLAALLAWAPAWTFTHAKSLPVFGKHVDTWRHAAIKVQVVLAMLGAVMTGVVFYRGAGRLEFFVGAIGVAALLLRFGGVARARPAAVVLAAVTVVAALLAVANHQAEGWGEGLGAVGLVCAALIAIPLALADGPRALNRSERNGLAWVLGSAGLALAFTACLAQSRLGELHVYITVGWGLAAVAVFLTGLFARVRPYRLLGLGGLALCIPRAFIVDLDSPWSRIIAFIALGVVLLWVGFSYHKLRHLLVEHAEETDGVPGTRS